MPAHTSGCKQFWYGAKLGLFSTFVLCILSLQESLGTPQVYDSFAGGQRPGCSPSCGDGSGASQRREGAGGGDTLIMFGWELQPVPGNPSGPAVILSVPQVPSGSGPPFTLFACCDRIVSLWSYVLLAGPQVVLHVPHAQPSAEVNDSCLSPDQSFSQSVMIRYYHSVVSHIPESPSPGMLLQTLRY